MTDLYEPDAFFDRVDELWLKGPVVAEPGWRRFAATHPWLRLRKHARSWIEASIVITRESCCRSVIDACGSFTSVASLPLYEHDQTPSC
jgi:hypothetical protein